MVDSSSHGRTQQDPDIKVVGIRRCIFVFVQLIFINSWHQPGIDIGLDLHGGSLFRKVRTKHSRNLYTVEVLYPHLIHDNRAVELYTALSIVRDVHARRAST